MLKLNRCFTQLKSEYIFPIIDKKLAELKQKVPPTALINLGVGDIALPLAPSIVQAIQQAVGEMGTEEGIRGYPPTYGYDFLRSAIATREYAGLNICAEEIYVSDGINSDAVHMQDIIDPSCVIAIPDPTYPAYLNSTVIGGKKRVVALPCLEENHFQPLPPEERCDVIYLCSPNNPTGVAMTKKKLQSWIDYARAQESILLIDSAYAAFITSPDVPKTIYELPGAHSCAIELKSFSKSAGFTGLRCSYAVIPHTVSGRLGRKKYSLHRLWEKRQDIKFNGVAYPIQRGAQAALEKEGFKETQTQVHFYLSLAKQLKERLTAFGHTCWGGEDSPYIWWKTPKPTTSWEFFDHLLDTCHLITVPGIGFGKQGEGYIRLSGFSTQEKITLAIERIREKV